MHREDLGIGLLILFNQKAPTRIFAEATGVDAHHVDGRFAIHNPVRQLPTRTTSSGYPETMTLIQPKVFEAPCRSDNRRAVGRIGDSAIIDFLDANFAKGRHPLHGRQDIRLKPL